MTPNLAFSPWKKTLTTALALGTLGMAASRADILYVSDGTHIVKVASNGVGQVFATNTVIMQGVAFDSGGNLYAAGYTSTNNTIEKFTPGGTGSVFAFGPLIAPTGLAFDSASTLYVANSGNNSISKFTPDGTGSFFANAGLNAPEGMAFDSTGNLYVANEGNNTIEKFPPHGAPSLFASTGLNEPCGLAFDSTGNLYAANFGNNTIEEFTPSGSASVFASTGLSEPAGLAFDSTGNLYVTNYDISTIEKFSPGGTPSLFASSPLDDVINPGFLAITTDTGVPLLLANQVPEPATSALLLLGVATLARRPRPSARKTPPSAPPIPFTPTKPTPSGQIRPWSDPAKIVVG